MKKDDAKKEALKAAKEAGSRDLKQSLAELYNEDMLFLGDTESDFTYDEALVGVVESACKPTVACYDYNKCIECLVRDGMTHEDAHEWMSVNVTGAYLGENTPVFLHLLDS